MAERGPEAARRPSRRPTLGLLTANIHLGVGATLWAGVLEAAERADANLVCFPGDSLRPSGTPRNVLYELLEGAGLDGVICWTSTLGLPAPGPAAARLVGRLARLGPVVSLNRALEGHESETLLLDSYAGMRKAVSHLVERHGRRRLACLRGPLANPVSLNRFRAYADALARHRIPQDRALVSSSLDYANGAGASAMRVLLDVRGLRPGRDFDAVVACSDALAADALRLLTERGVRVPEDVALISFNDSLEARVSDPPLTSVALPFAELGALAVDTLLARLRGREGAPGGQPRPPSRRVVPGTLVIRRSCGCHSPLVAQGAPDAPAAPGPARPEHAPAARPEPHAPAHPVPHPLPDAGPRPSAAHAPAPSRVRATDAAPGSAHHTGADSGAGAEAGAEAAAAAVTEAVTARGPEAGREPEAGAEAGRGTEAGREAEAGAEPEPEAEGAPLPVEVRGAFRADLADAGGTAFLHALERHLGGRIQSFEDAAAWDRALLRLRARTPPGRRAERLLGQARLMVADKAHRLLEYEHWSKDQEARRLRELATALTTVVDTGAIDEALARHLPGLGVRGHRLVLGPGPGPGPSGGAGAGAGTVPGEVPLPAREPDGTDRPAGDRPGEPPCAVPRFTAVLEPLHIGGEQLGYVVFEAGPARAAARQGALYRALGDQISAALKGVRLFQEVRRARDAAEQASRFKTRLLSNATDELRTPVEAILRHTRPGEPAHEAAGGLLRLIDDLLDLSRSEIDGLDLSRHLLDPRPLLAEVAQGHRLRLPRRLPAVRADPARLRQIVHNLLAAAGHRAELTAEPVPPWLSVTVTSPALALPRGEDEQLFQPFASGGLGLAIARRLAVLHGGSVVPHRGPGGSGFRLDLPLPTPAEPPPKAPGAAAPPGDTLLTVDGTPPELAALARDRGLRPHRPHPDEDVATVLAAHPPAAVVWDAEQATAHEWSTARRLHDHPALRHTPFLLYGLAAAGAGAAPQGGPADLNRALHALRPSHLAAPAVLVDGSAASRERLRRLLTALLPGRQVRAAADGRAALALLAEEAAPGLLVTDRALPDMDGFELVERLPGVPALMLSDAGFTFADVRRAEPHPQLVLLGRDILTEEETAAVLTGLVERGAAQRAADPAPVRYALAYIEQHYRHRFSRWQIAQAAGVSEDHLGRLFHRELGLTLWEYLNRLRIKHAKERLRRSDDSVQTIARAVGFHDRAYFSRVFRKLTGVAPHAYRDALAAEGGKPRDAPAGATVRSPA
ncbi:substrate-binding domain-containing protein [Streptomyces hoynatensis]|uniref:histidine kinase n=1 Tax=Streptomyces hoynatensis TaxID=1141874 RepID=A0A3A9YPV3_9ACTN|nr:substrate-binding domain-containing protein [Streptomyces hoynatensis]RKN37514.1 helix-turn-helix domain-containing protein [Streptomyces hoynatensis]